MSIYGELRKSALQIIKAQKTQDIPIGVLFDKFEALATPVAVLALLAEVDALRKEIAALKPSQIRTEKTTIGYTGCVICGRYADHGGLQCPNLAARSLSMENQRIVPVEPIRVDHPLDAAMSKGEQP